MQFFDMLTHLLSTPSSAFVVGGLNGKHHEIHSAPMPTLPDGPLFLYDSNNRVWPIHSAMLNWEWELVGVEASLCLLPETIDSIISAICKELSYEAFPNVVLTREQIASAFIGKPDNDMRTVYQNLLDIDDRKALQRSNTDPFLLLVQNLDVDVESDHALLKALSEYPYLVSDGSEYE